ncbi:MAG: MBL fold metallo-hydrolase [Gemmatimonadetes bacterium]|nr:MBL fold metallo-hydrolase [Gemmatimonadota bacterium]
MTRRRAVPAWVTLASAWVTLGTLFGFSPAAARQDRPPALETIHVAGNVYMLQTPTAGGNIGVFTGPDGVLLVDDQFAPLSESIISAVSEISDTEIRFLINTHIHPDHIGGNENLAELGVLIFAHDHVRLRMLQQLRIPRRGGMFFPQPPEGARPVVTYSEAVTFHLNGEEVRAFLVPPAHTDGDSFVYFSGSDVLHLGDVFRTNMYPIIDVYNGGTFSGMIEALEIAIGLAGPDTKVIPGHGFGFTDREGLIEVLVMMLDIRHDVTTMIAQGRTLDEVMAADLTAEYDEKWGQVDSWNASDLLPIVYREYSGR